MTLKLIISSIVRRRDGYEVPVPFLKYMSNKSSKLTDPDRIQVSVYENEITGFQKKNKNRKHRVSVPLILVIIWIGLYFGSIIFNVTYYMPGTGGDSMNRMSHYMIQISTFIENSYNLIFHAGPTGNIEASYWRLFAVALAGAALAACGAVFQGAFRNVLAGPSTMGVMSGGSMGCMIYLLCFYSSGVSVYAAGSTFQLAMSFWQRFQQQLCVLVGCFGGVLLVLLVATVVGRGKVSSSAMIIAGTVFSGVISNVTMVCQYWIMATDPSDSRIEDMREMMMGSFDDVTSLSMVSMMGIPILVCLVLLIAVSGKLNILSFGEEEALSMGLNVRFYKNLMILIGTILTAMVVSFCGRIGFIGFMVPMIVRRLTGPDLKKLLPVAMLGGAVFLTVIYDIACMFQLQSNISMVTGPLGCIVMVITLFRKGGGRSETGKSAAAPGMGIR